MTKLIHQDLTYTIRGALFDVYNALGPMLPEEFYQKAVTLALENVGVPVEREKAFEVYYRGQRVGLYYVDHWVAGGKVLLELKVAPEIAPLHQAQAISYLKVTGADLALLVNFGAASLEVERLPNFVSDRNVEFQWQKAETADDNLHPDLSNQLLELLHRVHFELGPGFFHQVYRRATMLALQEQGLAYDYIKKLPIMYQHHQLGQQDVRLIVVAEKILLATIAVNQLTQAMQAHFKARLNHLKLQLGLLVNFNSTRLEMVWVRR